MTDYPLPPDVQYRTVRDLSELTLFDDLFTSPDYLGAYSDENSTTILQFDGTVTDAQMTQIVDRITHTPEQEIIIRDARNALTALRNQILDPALANTTWTTAQLSSRMRLVARVVEGLVKLELNDMSA